MSSIVKISVNPSTLITSIIVEDENQKVINDLKLICAALSDEYAFNNYTFTIPWYEFRRGLNEIATILKRASVKVQFDEFSTLLVKEAIQDKKGAAEKLSALTIDKNQLQEALYSAGFSRTLKEEQIRDAFRLLKLKHGANFSVPGAGKTTTILAVHTILKQNDLVTKLFVVSPINAFISWEDEIKDIFEKKDIIVERLTRSHLEDVSLLNKTNADVILVNYEKLRRDVSKLIPFFIQNKIHLILDESHRVKSGTNNISYNQIIKLADLAKRRDILSGTPMPQNFLDLEPQFDFLWPGQNIIPSELSNNIDKESQINQVNQAIEGLFVRTTKKELGLKDPTIDYTTIKMGPIQSELYQLFKSEAARIIAGLDKATKSDFRRIGRSVVKLLQASTNPMLLSLKDEYFEETLPIPLDREFWELLDDFSKYEKPVKIEYLTNRVKEITSKDQNSKVLIWSYFVRNIQILERLLMEYNPVAIYGGVPTGSDEDELTREGRIRTFHEDPTCRVMIANPQACGEGISLHKVCHHAIYLDRNFNAAYFLQSIDRIHRLGLDQSVDTKIEILIAENSIDEILINRLNDKIKDMGSVLEDPYLHSLAYDPADISSEDEFGIDEKDFEALKKHLK